MLDLSHPMSRHVFRAAGLMDGVMVRGQRMSVSPRAVRADLLNECVPMFAEMRDLATGQFGMQATLLTAAIDEYEAAIRVLSGLGGGEVMGLRDGVGSCPVCGALVIHHAEYGFVLCGECDKPFMLAHSKLEEGFGTWLI